MSKQTTTINVYIQGDTFVAECPHVPDGVKGSHPKNEARAIDEVIRNVRAYRKRYEDAGEPVPWVETVQMDKAAVQTLHLTGLWPETVASGGVTSTAEDELESTDEESEVHDG